MREIKEAETVEHTFTTGDTSNRFPSDNNFRQHGFSIHARPSGGPARWTTREGLRSGLSWSEEEVMDMIFQKEKAPK